MVTVKVHNEREGRLVRMLKLQIEELVKDIKKRGVLAIGGIAYETVNGTLRSMRTLDMMDEHWSAWEIYKTVAGDKEE